MSVSFDEKNAIEVKNLNKSYKNFALKDVSFDVPRGCVTGFIGQNGAGKSTTIKSILNMVSRDRGDIRVFGEDNIEQEQEIKENVGVVFDTVCFHEKLKLKHIDKILKGIYRNWNSQMYYEYLERFALPANKKVGELSRGMTMKLQIATALSHEAKLLIMDEPTGGLDPVVRNEILDIFMDFIQDEEHTIFLSSHILSDIERIADYIVFIDRGEVLLSEDKNSVASRHGILKCSAEQFEKVDRADVIGTRKSSFGIEALVGDFEKCAAKYSDLLCERTTLEEIMLFYAKRG